MGDWPAQLLDELLGPGGDVPGEVYRVNALEDDIVGLHGVGAGEGRRAGEQLEHEDPERPVVGRDVVALVEDDLRGDVLGGAAERPGLPANLDNAAVWLAIRFSQYKERKIIDYFKIWIHFRKIEKKLGTIWNNLKTEFRDQENLNYLIISENEKKSGSGQLYFLPNTQIYHFAVIYSCFSSVIKLWVIPKKNKQNMCVHLLAFL